MRDGNQMTSFFFFFGSTKHTHLDKIPYCNHTTWQLEPSTSVHDELVGPLPLKKNHIPFSSPMQNVDIFFLQSVGSDI